MNRITKLWQSYPTAAKITAELQQVSPYEHKGYIIKVADAVGLILHQEEISTSSILDGVDGTLVVIRRGDDLAKLPQGWRTVFEL